MRDQRGVIGRRRVPADVRVGPAAAQAGDVGVHRDQFGQEGDRHLQAAIRLTSLDADSMAIWHSLAEQRLASKSFGA